jgi:hypothetical protein
MKHTLLKYKRKGITISGIIKYNDYRFSDMASYGQFLIYQGLLPKYYFNCFDERYEDIIKYAKGLDIPIEKLLKRVLKLSSIKDLKITARTPWISWGDSEAKAEFVEYEVEDFPMSIWDEVKGKL